MHVRSAIVSVLLACVGILQASQVAAQYQQPPIIIAGGSGAPEKLRAGNQYYDFTLDGVEEYMAELERRSPGTHSQLEGDLQDMLDAESSALTWTLVTIAAGAGMIAGGVAMFANDDRSGLYVISLGVVVCSLGPFIVYGAISTGRDEMLGFVNKHNRIYPEKPLQLGRKIPRDRTPTLALRLEGRF